MFTKQEVLEKMQNAKTWREAGLTIEDVRPILQADDSNGSFDRADEITELREKVNKLTEANKQLRAENKQLRSR